MKITWFAAMTFRIHIAGRIIVIESEGAPEGVDPGELVSGAQTVVSAARNGSRFRSLHLEARGAGG